MPNDIFFLQLHPLNFPEPPKIAPPAGVRLSNSSPRRRLPVYTITGAFLNTQLFDWSKLPNCDSEMFALVEFIDDNGLNVRVSHEPFSKCKKMKIND